MYYNNILKTIKLEENAMFFFWALFKCIFQSKDHDILPNIWYNTYKIADEMYTEFF